MTNSKKERNTMQTWEILSWSFVTSWAVLWTIRPLSPRFHLALVASFVTLLSAQAVLEGARFHLLPIFALGGILSALGFLRVSRLARAVSALPLGVLAALGFLLPSVFPVFRFDEPGGKYGIGTAVYEVKDTARKRDLAFQVWYPTAPGAPGERASITTRPEAMKDAYAKVSGLPAALFDHLRLIRTHAVLRAHLAGEGKHFPVVLFSHGPIAANRSQSIFQMEALASHGFVVVAIDHTGASSVSIFPDGRTVPVDPRVKWPVFADSASGALVETWVGDVRVVLDRLEVLNASDPLLRGRLALDRVGYLGASFGGSVVVEALLDEPRIKAGVAEDGKPYFFDRALTDLRRPLLYLRSSLPYIPVSDEQLRAWGITAADFERAKRDHYARLERLVASARAPLYDVLLDGTDHVSFSDLHLIVDFPSAHLGDQRRAHRIINAYTLDFFERYLNGVEAPLASGSAKAPYPEVTVRAEHVGPGPISLQ
jgi:hypothetical protein